jgi:rRNA pseudouridine-1189 N-methylase Emg1 (Nep1/Mra1 family)
MKMTKKEQMELLAMAQRRITDRLTEYGDVTLLGLKEKGFYEYNRGYASALEDVIALLHGNPVYIKILAGK